jgi:RNA polymerase sigma-70 factor (ECF subfamily)
VDQPQLIARVLAGDPVAERQLYDDHVDRVYRLAFRMAGDDDLAQEFTQETFIRAFSRLRDFRGDAALSTWLHSIAVSVCLNGLRKTRRFRTREVDLQVHGAAAETRDKQSDPMLKQKLHRAIDALAERYRVVFLMHDVEGYTHEEIGEVLSLPAGTSKARLSRARAKLRDTLGDLAGEWVS